MHPERYEACDGECGSCQANHGFGAHNEGIDVGLVEGRGAWNGSVPPPLPVRWRVAPWAPAHVALARVPAPQSPLRLVGERPWHAALGGPMTGAPDTRSMMRPDPLPPSTKSHGAAKDHCGERPYDHCPAFDIDPPPRPECEVTDATRQWEMPPFENAAVQTQFCFAFTWGASAWPATGCCPLPKPKAWQYPCEVPSWGQRFNQLLRLRNHNNRYFDDPCKFDGVSEASPTTADLDLVGAAMHLLEANFDAAFYVLCTLQAWSPEMKGLKPKLARWFQWMMTPDDDGYYPLHITYVRRAARATKKTEVGPGEQTTDGATAWAFTTAFPTFSDCSVGIIVPIHHRSWQLWTDKFAQGGAPGLCRAIQVAGIFLHEMVHIAADARDAGASGKNSPYSWANAERDDRHGALHDDSLPVQCWDEGRMAALMFERIVVERYRCFAGTYCERWLQDAKFAHSGRGI